MLRGVGCTCVVVRGDWRILSKVLRMSSTSTQAGPSRWCSLWATLNRVRRACTFLGVRTTPSDASVAPPVALPEELLVGPAAGPSLSVPKQDWYVAQNTSCSFAKSVPKPTQKVW